MEQQVGDAASPHFLEKGCSQHIQLTEVGVGREAARCQLDGRLQHVRRDSCVKVGGAPHSVLSKASCSNHRMRLLPPFPNPTHHSACLRSARTWNRRFHGRRPCRWCAVHMPRSSSGTATARPPLMAASGRPATGQQNKVQDGQLQHYGLEATSVVIGQPLRLQAPSLLLDQPTHPQTSSRWQLQAQTRVHRCTLLCHWAACHRGWRDDTYARPHSHAAANSMQSICNQDELKTVTSTGSPDEHEVAAACAAGLRVEHALAQSRGNGGIHGIAALLQHRSTCGSVGGQGMQSRRQGASCIGEKGAMRPAVVLSPACSILNNSHPRTNVAAAAVVGCHEAACRGHAAWPPAVVVQRLKAAFYAACVAAGRRAASSGGLHATGIFRCCITVLPSELAISIEAPHGEQQ